jgi:hypothetical protein
MKTAATSRMPAARLNAMFSLALILSMAAFPAKAQEASGRAGVYYGGQIIYSTPYSTDKIKANAAGAAL